MKIATVLLMTCLAGCSRNFLCDDYVVQWDAAFHSYYIYSCTLGFPMLEIGYGSFSSEAAAFQKVKEIRMNDADPNSRTHFIQVPH